MDTTMKSPFIRPLFDIGILVSIFLLPWWASCIFAIIGLFLFQNYYEIIFFGFILDSLYSPQGNAATGLWKYTFIFSSFGALSLQLFLKSKLRL